MTKLIISVADNHSPKVVAKSLEMLGIKILSVPWWTGNIEGAIEDVRQIEQIKSVQGVYQVYEITR